jgi:hypothetical protein
VSLCAIETWFGPRRVYISFARASDPVKPVDRLYSGYGETAGGGMRGGKQSPIFEGGNAYLDREFPLLDRLLRAGVMTHRR